MQMERKFLYQLGKNALANKKGDDAIDYFVKSLTVAANDDERGESFEGLSLAYFAAGKVDSAIEYGVKASTTFQRQESSVSMRICRLRLLTMRQ